MTAVSIPAVRRRPAPAPLRLVSDDRLSRLAAKGDQRAFASIYERYHQPLYRYCRSILRSDEDAADALQNTMARVLRALPGEEREIALKPWLYRIAHNESLRMLSSRRPQAELQSASALTGPSLEQDVATRERLDRLVTDLGELPERQRSALVMRELGGVAYDYIAGALGISAAAAKQTVYEARTSLQEAEQGREMDCDTVGRSISARDRRRLRGRRVRAHLRHCGDCRALESAIRTRRSDLAAIAPPLPAAAAAAMLDSLLGGGGGSGGRGLLGLLTG
ncbi:MAG: RNA polymerase sigma factor, partial [Actinomycetota bacterium]|nr:RNA polymerase sigma factor [Actinomycetota bacterium]